ncbi:pantetheine-phosphate adenylyltransferase [Desulfocapsa sulfexigens DSM 10523]|uniref:Phosphopantetheine adenylyltransferase n=1 Tax=Desulfocapsa sulfexigens (strain DSM 10523 / SB164P1) TaxID=1167006 RepID=M1NHP8_DESSD|nr:pantetheine-phosphate adenylyltransferase [Desulfocapsa sulfexigens]AGF79124.1 pantetheine-phosphate adenylyltransferase [Desulfocapsa sulfexigens DSM 10523]
MMPHDNSDHQRKSLAIYPGTFDPITMGHLDIIDRALNLFDKVIIAIAINPGKKPLFSLEERTEMARQCFPKDYSRIEVDTVSGLLVKYAADKGANAIIRGLRAVSDFDYEFQLALMNRKLEREVDTIFLMPGFRWIYISSSIIKDAARHGGDVCELVPEHVNQRLLAAFT